MNKKFLLYLSLFFLLLLAPSSVFANFDFNANCLKAYQLILELKLGSARQLIAAEKKANPGNLIVPLLENYGDYFYLLTNESKADFERLERNKSLRLDQIEEGDESSPYYLFAQAEINLQWSMIRGRYGEYFTAAREIKRANSLLQENSRKFPGFHLNAKGLGIIQAFLGNLPDGILKSTLSTFGLKGNLQEGMSILERLADGLPKSRYEFFYEEVVFNYAFILIDVAHSPAAYAKTMKYTARISDGSLLKTYLQALVSTKTAHNEEAIALLANRPSGPAYQSFPYLELLEGIARLNKLDYGCVQHFNRFLAVNKGVNYIKDAYLHLGWVSLLKGDTDGYEVAMSKVKSAGHIYDERDKQAMNEANSPRPNLLLLKARLLYDGGYYARAQEVLGGTLDRYTGDRDQAEYYYRTARISDSLGKPDMALASYQQAIAKGQGLKYYFAANSALQIGKIYERNRDYIRAKQYFNKAIQMKDHEYESSIETQAKAGLKRIAR